MGILGGGGGTSNFERLLESATSQLQLEPNWAHILELCDSVRQKDVTAKYAVAAMRKKMQDRNPHVVKFALVTLEACMKNCGGIIHDEVATREVMDELRSLATTGSDPVKEQTLSMIQTWNQTLGKKATYRIIQDTYNLLKAEGHSFPQLHESEAMYSAETAPEWAEGDLCHQCRVRFSTFTRQHHCRCCGQVFCAKCSSKNSIIPKFGIEREVRVCDTCYDSINPGSSASTPKKKPASANGETQSLDSDGLPAEYLNSSLAKEAQTKAQTSEAELKAQEEEEFQLAMALSLSAAESEKQPAKNWASATTADSSHSSTPSSTLYSEPKSNLYSDVVADSKRTADASDSELSRYLNRQYWEKRKDDRVAEPSAPVVHEVEEHIGRGSAPYVKDEPVEVVEENAGDSDAFVDTMSKSITMFINRMQTVTAKGKHIAMDSTVQSLFQSLSAMHPQLMKLIEDEEDNKAKYQAMLEKIALIREARASLDDMRNQHREKLGQQELEQEMLRRMQMEQKLELMRQQKQEYLEYQRQLQIQRQQELEAQQQIKYQQKQYVMQGPFPGIQYGMPGQFGPEGVPVSAAYPVAASLGQVSQPGPPSMGQAGPTTLSQAGPASIGQMGSPAQMQFAGQYPQTSVSYGTRPEQPPPEGPNQPGQSQGMQSQVVSGPPQSMPQMDQTMYRGQGQPPMTQQFRQPQGQMQPVGNMPPQSQPQAQQPQQPQQQPPTQYAPQVPDLLDAPIVDDQGQQRQQMQDPRSQNYSQQPMMGNQQQQQQQQNVPSQHQQQPYSQSQPQMQQQQQFQQRLPQQPSPQQQQQPHLQQQQQPPQPQQQQPPQQQQLPPQQQQQFVSPARQQIPPQQQQQQHPPSQQQQQSIPYQQPATQQTGAPKQFYQTEAPSLTPAGSQAPYGGQAPQPMYQQAVGQGQPQMQGGQDPYQQQPPNQYAQLSMPQQQQSPSSLPYMGQGPVGSQGPGPASLPASMNQYPVGGQGYQQQNQYSQQQQQEPQMTETMKDLQLISFE